MRVLHVIPSVGVNRGGPSVVMRQLAPALAQAGVEIDVVTTDDDGRARLARPLPASAATPHLRYFYFPRQLRFYTFSWPLYRWLSANVARYDLVHIHSLFSFPSLAAARCARKARVPYVVRPLGVLNRWGRSNRRPWLKRLSFALLERQILSKAAAVHFTTEAERQEASELGVPMHAETIPNPVPVADRSTQRGSFRKSRPELANRIWILFLSRLDPVKGLDLLFAAYAQLRSSHPETLLIIAGNGEPSFVAKLQRQSRELAIDDHILWTGFLGDEQKQAAFVDADVFILPSYSENFGLVAIEALSAGCPVIVSDKVGVSHDIAAATAGLVAECTSDSIAQALTILLKNPQSRANLAQRGKILARDRYSTTAVVNQLIELYSRTSKPASI